MLVSEGSERVKTAPLSFKLNHCAKQLPRLGTPAPPDSEDSPSSGIVRVEPVKTILTKRCGSAGSSGTHARTATCPGRLGHPTPRRSASRSDPGTLTDALVTGPHRCWRGDAARSSVLPGPSGCSAAVTSRSGPWVPRPAKPALQLWTGSSRQVTPWCGPGHEAPPPLLLPTPGLTAAQVATRLSSATAAYVLQRNRALRGAPPRSTAPTPRPPGRRRDRRHNPPRPPAPV